MKCLNDEIIQIYIDGETSAEENLQVKTHIESCQSCAQKVETLKARSIQLKTWMNTIDKTDIEIPVFSPSPIVQRKRNTTLRKWVYAASAACIVILLTLFLQKPKENTNLMYSSYEVAGEFNANLPLSEQEMEIVIISEDGKIVTF